ncbi:hypothetical protein LTR37_011430 [Vermiconidia calcicola]|uniref:Uncharacterized protein n=1 Tax=Vermiconidia calcicola TaxID=1690605 RepID=A0ACC3N261_9PEZI|nr:hypothetical protein LTR37_011430 [Vermiconidia calcicola]
MDNSILSTLPLELREAIYELTLCTHGPIRIDIFKEQPYLISPTSVQVLALTTTCKQIRAESERFFWTHNTFAIFPGTVHELATDAAFAVYPALVHELVTDAVFAAAVTSGQSTKKAAAIYAKCHAIWRRNLLNWVQTIGLGNLRRIWRIQLAIGPWRIGYLNHGGKHYLPPLIKAVVDILDLHRCGLFLGKERGLTMALQLVCNKSDYVDVEVPLSTDWDHVKEPFDNLSLDTMGIDDDVRLRYKIVFDALARLIWQSMQVEHLHPCT